MQEWQSPVYYQVTAEDAEGWDEYGYDYEGGDWMEYEMFQAAGISIAITAVIVLLSVFVVLVVQKRRSLQVRPYAPPREGDAGALQLPAELMGSGSLEPSGDGYGGSLGQDNSRVCSMCFLLCRVLN